jgi:sugar lactone lactonase YvrE
MLPIASARAVPPRPLGSSKVVAKVPAPGFPEGIAVDGNKMYVASPAQNGHKGDAHIFAFDIHNGALLRDYRIPASDPITDHGLVGVALDGNGRLYVADIQRGVVRLDVTTGQSQTYAAIPDIPPARRSA